MALGLLCLSLVLMGALTAQAQDSVLKMIQSSILSMFPPKADFQDEKVGLERQQQGGLPGEWLRG